MSGCFDDGEGVVEAKNGKGDTDFVVEIAGSFAEAFGVEGFFECGESNVFGGGFADGA